VGPRKNKKVMVSWESTTSPRVGGRCEATFFKAAARGGEGEAVPFVLELALEVRTSRALLLHAHDSDERWLE
jgi:hypothetical protein